MSDLEKGDSLSGEKEELVNTGFDTSDEINVVRQDKYCSRKCSCSRIPRWVRCILILLVLITYYIIELEYTIYAYDYEKSTNITTGDDLHISARIFHHRGLHKPTCDKEEYGCCDIYYNCHVVGSVDTSHLDYNINHISLYRIMPKDVLKSNCPSLRSIIYQYNHHYGSNDCGKFGCCDDFHNIKCDDTIHNNLYNLGNSKKLVDIFNTNDNSISINVPKKDKIGSNCWNHGFLNGINHFVDKYEDNFPKDEECSWGCVIGYILVIVFLLGCVLQ